MDAVTESEQSKVQPHARAALCALPDILARGKFSKSHLYNLLARGQFVKPCLVMGPRFTRWNAIEVDQWFSDPARWIAEHANRGVAA